MPHLPQTTLGPDPEQCDRFADSLSSAAATEAVVQDIERLQKNIDVINDLFDKVARPLLKFDIQYFGRADHTSALSPQWNVFPKRFNAYVDNSRDSAAAASRIMHLYATTVLDRVKDMNCNVTSLVKEIEHFKEKVQKHIVVAKTVRGNFSEIAADIKEFKEIVQITIDLESITGPLSEDITKAVGNIQLLEQKVSNISEDLDKASDYMGLVATLAPRAVKILCTVAPTAAFQALSSIFSTPGVEANETPSLNARMQLLRSGTLEDIDNVAQRIEAIAHIWYNLRLDMMSLETDLNLCSGHAMVTSTFVMSRINASIAVWEIVSKCLHMFVRKPDLISTVA